MWGSETVNGKFSFTPINPFRNGYFGAFSGILWKIRRDFQSTNRRIPGIMMYGFERIAKDREKWGFMGVNGDYGFRQTLVFRIETGFEF
jgi:hypothetical protein